MLSLLASLAAATASWTVPWAASPSSTDRRETALRDFLALAASPDARTLRVYARPNKSCQAGRDASGRFQPGAASSGQREARDPRPWRLVGRVSTRSDTAVNGAIQAQRSLLEEEARLQHRALRPHRTLVLAWADERDEPFDEPVLGSFLCPRCGTQADAGAAACPQCGTPRPDYAPQGELTLARRVSGLAAPGESGFRAAAAEEEDDAHGAT